MGEFVRQVLTTPEGQKLIVVGNAVGFLFAVLAFSLSLISFPLLLDRNVGVAVAIITSIRAILTQPGDDGDWGLLVAGALLLGSLPFFIGLAVVMPVLGHSTWHLYRKVVEPDLSPRPEYHPRPRSIHYAADFPVSLFVRNLDARTISNGQDQAADAQSLSTLSWLLTARSHNRGCLNGY